MFCGNIELQEPVRYNKYREKPVGKRKPFQLKREVIDVSFTNMGVGCWFCSTAEGQCTCWTVTFNENSHLFSYRNYDIISV